MHPGHPQSHNQPGYYPFPPPFPSQIPPAFPAFPGPSGFPAFPGFAGPPSAGGLAFPTDQIEIPAIAGIPLVSRRSSVSPHHFVHCEPPSLVASEIGSFARAFEGNSGRVIAANGRFILYSVAQGLIRVISVSSGKTVLLKGHTGKILHLAIQQDSGDLASIANSGELIIWKIREDVGELQFSIVSKAVEVFYHRVFWLPGRFSLVALALGDSTTPAAIIDVSGPEQRVFRLPIEFPVSDCSIEESGRRAIFSSSAGEISIIEIEEGEKFRPTNKFSPHNGAPVERVFFIPRYGYETSAMIFGSAAKGLSEFRLWALMPSGEFFQLSELLITPNEVAEQRFSSLEVDPTGSFVFLFFKSDDPEPHSTGHGLFAIHLMRTKFPLSNELDALACRFDYLSMLSVTSPVVSCTALNEKRGLAMAGDSSTALQLELFCCQTKPIVQFHLKAEECYDINARLKILPEPPLLLRLSPPALLGPEAFGEPGGHEKSQTSPAPQTLAASQNATVAEIPLINSNNNNSNNDPGNFQAPRVSPEGIQRSPDSSEGMAAASSPSLETSEFDDSSAIAGDSRESRKERQEVSLLARLDKLFARHFGKLGLANEKERKIIMAEVEGERKERNAAEKARADQMSKAIKTEMPKALLQPLTVAVKAQLQPVIEEAIRKSQQSLEAKISENGDLIRRGQDSLVVSFKNILADALAAAVPVILQPLLENSTRTLTSQLQLQQQNMEKIAREQKAEFHSAIQTLTEANERLTRNAAMQEQQLAEIKAALQRGPPQPQFAAPPAFQQPPPPMITQNLQPHPPPQHGHQAFHPPPHHHHHLQHSAPPPMPPQQPPAPGIPPPPAEDRASFDYFLSNGLYNDAFTRALSQGRLPTVLWLCQQIDPLFLLAPNPAAPFQRLSSPVLLSLLQQVGFHFKEENSNRLKLGWLRELAAALLSDRQDPAIVKHIPGVVNQILSNMQQEPALWGEELAGAAKVALIKLTTGEN